MKRDTVLGNPRHWSETLVLVSLLIAPSTLVAPSTVWALSPEGTVGSQAARASPSPSARPKGMPGDRTAQSGAAQPGAGGQPGTAQPGAGGQPGAAQPGAGGESGTAQPGAGGESGTAQPGAGGQPGTAQPGAGGESGTAQPGAGGESGAAQPGAGGESGTAQPGAGGESGTPPPGAQPQPTAAPPRTRSPGPPAQSAQEEQPPAEDHRRAPSRSCGEASSASRSGGGNADIAPTAIAGFPLPAKQFSARLVLGYPFADFRLALGLVDTVDLFLGYRGMYSRNYGGYLGLKFGLLRRGHDRFGLSLTLAGGYLYVPYRWRETIAQVGGNGGFGEMILDATVRKGRHGVMVGLGLRIHQVPETPEWKSLLPGGKAGVLPTLSLEVGYELRLMRFASYFLAVGADMILNAGSTPVPAMVRFRTGVELDF